MTNNPYTLQNTVLRHIKLLDYRKVQNYAAYGLSFKPTELFFKPYLSKVYETGLKDYPYVVILDDSYPDDVISALAASTRPKMYRSLGSQGNTIPCWLQTAKQWLSSHEIEYMEKQPEIRTSDINDLKPTYIPQCYSNNISTYQELHVRKTAIDAMVLVNVPYRQTETTYILLVHKQTGTVLRRRQQEEQEEHDRRIYRCCEYMLHKHRQALLQSTIDNCKCDDTDKWLQINELLLKEEQWLTDHTSWNDINLYRSFGEASFNHGQIN
jgi:hypothetical protein